MTKLNAAKHFFLSLVAAAVLLPATAKAADVGLGVILFGPTGLSADFGLGGGNSVDAALSWDLNDDDENIYIHSTYLWHRPGLVRLDSAVFDVYYGVGARLIDYDRGPRWADDREDGVYLGIRGAGGMNYTFRNPRIELFGELSLTMNVVPETNADIDFALGARFRF